MAEPFRLGTRSLTVNQEENVWYDKVCQIEQLLAEPTIDLWQLRELALSPGGLVNDSIRRRAWPALCGLHNQAASTFSGSSQSSSSTRTSFQGEDAAAQLDPHQKNQVELDVARCTWHLLTGTQRIQRLQMEHKNNKRIAKVIRQKQQRLAACIESTLATVAALSTQDSSREQRSTFYCYYQGFHELASIVFTTLRDAAPPQNLCAPPSSTKIALPPALSLDLSSAVLMQLCQSHLGDFMQPTFLPLQTTLQLTIFPLVALFDAEIHEHLMLCDMDSPYFALPFLISWFSSEIRDSSLVKRLLDAFVTSHPAFPLYVCVAMLLHPYNKNQILNTECDFSSMHHVLANLPKNSSAVGWKYRPGAGYVSEHEEEEDDDDDDDKDHEDMDLASLQSEVSSLKNGTNGPSDGELVLVQAGILDDNLQRTSRPDSARGGGRETLSVDSSTCALTLSTSEDESVQKVPFQELLDLAIRLMHRVPPRKLVPLAQKYHGPAFVQEWLTKCQESGRLPQMLFQDPVSWTLNPTAPSDAWLRAKVRQARGLPPRASRSRHRRPTMSSSSRQNDFEPVSSRAFLRILRRKEQEGSPRAIVASGMARSTREEKRRTQRNRVMAGFLSVAVALMAWKLSYLSNSGESAANSAFVQ